MIEGTFDVAVNTPKYRKRGTLALKSAGERIDALLKLTDLDDFSFSGTCEDKEFTFEGTGEFGELGKVGYRAHGEVWGNSVEATCETSAGKVELFGTRLSLSAGSMESSNEYLMAASRADFSHEEAMYTGLYSDGS